MSKYYVEYNKGNKIYVNEGVVLQKILKGIIENGKFKFKSMEYTIKPGLDTHTSSKLFNKVDITQQGGGTDLISEFNDNSEETYLDLNPVSIVDDESMPPEQLNDRKKVKRLIKNKSLRIRKHIPKLQTTPEKK
jgi:hypothetical protein